MVVFEVVVVEVVPVVEFVVVVAVVVVVVVIVVVETVELEYVDVQNEVPFPSNPFPHVHSVMKALLELQTAPSTLHGIIRHGAVLGIFFSNSHSKIETVMRNHLPAAKRISTRIPATRVASMARRTIVFQSRFTI
jgi:hypothetical protein